MPTPKAVDEGRRGGSRIVGLRDLPAVGVTGYISQMRCGPDAATG